MGTTSGPVLAYGDGKFDPERDTAKPSSTLRDPVMKNTVALHSEGAKQKFYVNLALLLFLLNID